MKMKMSTRRFPVVLSGTNSERLLWTRSLPWATLKNVPNAKSDSLSYVFQPFATLMNGTGSYDISLKTKYTMAANPGPGWLCHLCAKASGADPFKKPAQPRKRAKPEERRKIISHEEKELPTLAALCINVSCFSCPDGSGAHSQLPTTS